MGEFIENNEFILGYSGAKITEKMGEIFFTDIIDDEKIAIAIEKKNSPYVHYILIHSKYEGEGLKKYGIFINYNEYKIYTIPPYDTRSPAREGYKYDSIYMLKQDMASIFQTI